MKKQRESFNLMKAAIPISFVAILIASLITAVMWITDKYQTKQDTDKWSIDFKIQNDLWKKSTDDRITRVEDEISNLRNGMNQIAVDVSYIRGRLEPKPSNNKQ